MPVERHIWVESPHFLREWGGSTQLYILYICICILYSGFFNTPKGKNMDWLALCEFLCVFLNIFEYPKSHLWEKRKTSPNPKTRFLPIGVVNHDWQMGKAQQIDRLNSCQAIKLVFVFTHFFLNWWRLAHFPFSTRGVSLSVGRHMSQCLFVFSRLEHQKKYPKYKYPQGRCWYSWHK